eukprot:CAMPEP_0204540854 /NCGR_PEP_ID=MMETSP0661-20131031/17796_1 /ASSEMBLY_ACC=CAM_ASM_000606 /TAXON_ID=109239 /ORGANISM="Alexandrium margalefi, Strain AMGDE01CS-322" /LENGTH=64 /DNA_ID=CAMNT_0051547517 /DNA_START=47 /DNA_END=238 /DNA_ORIENTATION=-
MILHYASALGVALRATPVWFFLSFAGVCSAHFGALKPACRNAEAAPSCPCRSANSIACWPSSAF